MALSVVLHGALVVLAFIVTYARAHLPKSTDHITIKFVTSPPPPPPPPPPAGHKPKTPRQTPRKPVAPKVVEKIVQPKEIPKEEKPPEPEPVVEEDEGVEGGVEGGVVGGVIGGVVGGTGTKATGPVEFNDTMAPPRVLSGPNPEYTDQAIEHEVQGTMVVKCTVSVQGEVRNCRILQSLPFMDRAVLDALHRRRYSPALLEGKPVEVDYTFKIRLTLPR